MEKFNHILEIQGKHWFDRVNGNSYFSARVYFDDELIAVLPFQYGYGSQYEYEARNEISKNNLIRGARVWFERNQYSGLWQFCQDKKIKLISNINSALKREVVAHGKN